MKVKPQKLVAMKLSDVNVGQRFILNDTQYVKLGSDDATLCGVPAITIKPIDSLYTISKCKVQTNVNCKARAKINTATKSISSFFSPDIDILSVIVPDVQTYYRYANLICKHIKDTWYVDGEQENECEDGDYYYVNVHSVLCKANQYQEYENSESRKLNLYAIYGIDNDAIVFARRLIDYAK